MNDEFNLATTRNKTSDSHMYKLTRQPICKRPTYMYVQSVCFLLRKPDTHQRQRLCGLRPVPSSDCHNPSKKKPEPTTPFAYATAYTSGKVTAAARTVLTTSTWAA